MGRTSDILGKRDRFLEVHEYRCKNRQAILRDINVITSSYVMACSPPFAPSCDGGEIDSCLAYLSPLEIKAFLIEISRVPSYSSLFLPSTLMGRQVGIILPGRQLLGDSF